MLSPIELNLFPSCPNCLSWSADGELAIGAGEYVHILTPRNIKIEKDNDENNMSQMEPTEKKPASEQWNIIRFRVNVFTNQEWPTIFPQNRNDFSIGVEQSLSTVAALAWSPPGLSKHRCCTLAVLTTNLLLSFYEPLGPQGKWVRVAIVNHSLDHYFSGITPEFALRFKKSNIRSFTWLPAFKVLGVQRSGTSVHNPYSVPDPATRWGIHLLAVANDDNDVLILETNRTQRGFDMLGSYSIEVSSVISLCDQEGSYPMMQPTSLFAAAVKSRAKVSSISCGPWSPQSNTAEGTYSRTAAVATTYGTQLKVIKFHLKFTTEEQSSRKLEYSMVEYPVAASVQKYNFTGPLQWLYTDDSQTVCLAAGVFGGLVTIFFSKAAYDGRYTTGCDFQVSEQFFGETGQGKPKHWEPIYAMTTALNEKTYTRTLHVGTKGGYVSTHLFPDSSDKTHSHIPSWAKKLEDIREGFDLDHDLGGLAIARIWGLASYHGLVAAAATMHPGDMIEYRTAMNERSSLIFSSGDQDDDGPGHPTFPKIIVDRSPNFLRQKREAIYGLILTAAQADEPSKDIWSQRLVYSASCCAVVDGGNKELLPLAQRALQQLADITGADLKEEISKCIGNTESNNIQPKSAAQLSGPGGYIFEKCEICDTGITWSSAQEAQCETGHLFVRCGLTFLCIHEPGISKFCSVCNTEYLNEDLLKTAEDDHGSGLGGIFEMVLEAFDTCVYCGGKYRS